MEIMEGKRNRTDPAAASSGGKRRAGLEPNVWFGNVERVASERIGRETVTDVSNIDKYYVAYRLVLEHRQRKDAAKVQVAGKKRTDFS
jgi:membrane-bound lytic murein transglycosylase MltF